VDERGSNWAEICSARFLTAVLENQVLGVDVPGGTDLGEDPHIVALGELHPVNPEEWERVIGQFVASSVPRTQVKDYGTISSTSSPVVGSSVQKSAASRSGSTTTRHLTDPTSRPGEWSDREGEAKNGACGTRASRISFE